MSSRVRDVAIEGVLHVTRRPLRSFLTAITSAVAIAVTVNVISLSYGLDEDVRRDVSRFGRLTVDVGRLPVLVAGLQRSPLGPAEEALVRKTLADLDPVVVTRRQVAASLRKPEDPPTGAFDVQALGTTEAYLRTMDVSLAAGRWFGAADGPEACVLDQATAKRLFPRRPAKDALGADLVLALPAEERRVRVVGVLTDPLTYRDLFDAFDEGRGARTLTSSLLSFRNVYVPDAALGEGDYTGISAVLPSEAAVDEAGKRLGRIWPQMANDPTAVVRSGVGVFVRKDWMAVLGASTSEGAFLGNIVWLIIVGVAVVMISTLNLITIRERYDELAIRRCEGARRRDVAFQVTVEGILTAVAGGLLGLPLGYLGAEVLRDVVGFPFRFEARYALAATGVAVALGLVASVIPARRAAKLEPARVLTRRLT
jgi:putative ABC transport system permease protein